MVRRAKRDLALFNALFVFLSSMGLYLTLGVATAFAASGTSFEITDGNTAGANDWDGNGAAYHITAKDDVCGNSAEDMIVSSTKLDDEPWPLDNGQVLGKGDLCKVWTGYEQLTNGDIVFLFGWLRDTNVGEVTVYVPIADTALAGRAGDLMFRFFYESSSSSITVDELAWNGSSWVDSGSSVAFDFGISAETKFSEVAINLMDAGILPRGSAECAQLVTGDVITETGEQGNANPTLKDFVDLPPLSLNNCATVTVIKDTNPEGYNGPFIFDLVGANYSQTNQSLAGDGSTQVYTDVVPGSYSLTEDDPSALGFALESIVCDGVDVTGSTFTVAVSGNHTCVITNEALPGSITLVKTVNNANGSTATADDFQAELDGADVAWSTAIPVEVGSYVASETMLVPGYTASAWGGDCAAGGSVDIGPGEHKTCTITNSDAPLSVQLEKSATPASRPEPGGLFEFTLTITNTSNEPVTITDLDDTRAGESPDYAINCDALIGDVLASGASTSCTYHATYTDAGVYPNDADVEVTDDDGRTAIDDATATVTVDDVESTMTVTKTAGVASLPEPGGNVTYTVTVKNESAVDDLTIDSIVDDQFGVLTGDADCQVGTVLAPGAICGFTFVGAVTGAPGYSHTNVVTVEGTDEDGLELFDTDDANVVITDVPSSITVTKTPSVSTVNEPGAPVTFTVEVENTSAVDTVRIDSLIDDVFGDLDGVGDCSAPQTLVPGATYECSFTEQISGDAGYVHTNTVTASGVDDDGAAVSDDDDAVVTVVDVLPQITVLKSAGVANVPEPGGDVTYTVQVTNNSVENVTLTSLSDDRFGVLAGDADCQVGTVLAPGATCSFTFVGAVSGDAGDSHVNVVTAVAVDNEQNEATDDDDATVGFTDVLPVINVVKTANPTGLDEPGGLVDFEVTVTNQSVEAVWLTSLVDDQFGDVFGLSADCAALENSLLDPGESVPCSFDELITGNAGFVHTNVVTGTAEDNEGNEATDDDDAVVAIGDLPASIEITKTPSVGSVDENGAWVEFTLVITNTSLVDAVTITDLTDSVYGDLDDPDNVLVDENTCDEVVGVELAAAGGSVECSFLGFVGGNAGDVHNNVATVTGVDDDQNEVSDDDDATVTIGDVASSIDVTKTPSVETVLEPGDTVTFTVVVTNTSPVDTVTIDSLVDDIYGDLDGQGTCSLGEGGIVLEPGEDYTCAFDGPVEGQPGYLHVNTVTAEGYDDDDNPVSDEDDAEVEVLDVPSSIEVTKTASVTTILEPGGLVTFTVTVTNTSEVDSVTIDSLVDDIYGDLDGKGTCAADFILEPGDSYSCSFQGQVSGSAGTVHHNTVTVEGTDDDENPVDDTDDETVTVIQNPGTVSGLVWFDADDDGIQDAGEPGVAGVAVELVPSTPSGYSATTVTGADGRYLFSGVPTGSYLVRVTAPAGFTGWAKVDQGGNDAIDSDVSFIVGSNVSTRAGKAETGAFVVAPGGSAVLDGGLVVEVLQVVVTTTTVPPVTASTLPFTGFEAGQTITLGLMALLAGGMFLLVGRRKDEEPVTATRARWSD
jgi:SdrD B-like domain/Domain of unknown function DUF11